MTEDQDQTEGQTVELWGPPVFGLGDKVVSVRDVRNDGTFPGARMGEVLIAKGAVGYVHSVGTYLNRYYIYGIDFIEAARVVGMRAAELDLVEAAPDYPPASPARSAAPSPLS